MDLWSSRRSVKKPASSTGDGLPMLGGDVRLDQTPPTGGLPDPMVPQTGEMPFLDHLEELRWRIIKGLAAILVSAIACLFFAQWIVDVVLLGPTREDFFMYDLLRLDAISVTLQNRTVTGQFFAYFGTVIAAGIVIASPMVVYQTWKFIEPGLYPDERKGLRFASVFATFFFALGIAFGYLIIAPLALQFFAQFAISESIVNEFDITRYFSMLLTWSFGAGLLFELPVVVVILAKLGVLTQAMLRAGRRYALVVILVISAFVTPPDPWSMFMMAIPLLGLYELSIVLTGSIERRRLRQEQAEAAAIAKAAAAPADESPSA